MSNENVVCALVKNQAGVLARISGLFSRRGYNIESLTVGSTHDPEISRMTIRVICDENILDQLVQQLLKLVCVLNVEVLPQKRSVYRELVLVKVKTDDNTRGSIIEIANIFRASVIDVSPESVTLEVTGENQKINAFYNLLENYGVIELTRTGTVALERGKENLHQEIYTKWI